VQGLGEKCPYYLDPTKNDLTGRRITRSQVKELIVQLHNEVSLGAVSSPPRLIDRVVTYLHYVSCLFSIAKRYIISQY
jgi:hypothetical protein